MSGEPFFDHVAKSDGQNVHCQRAAFIANNGIPFTTADRIALGFALGFGLSGGMMAMVGIVAIISHVLHLLGLPA